MIGVNTLFVSILGIVVLSAVYPWNIKIPGAKWLLHLPLLLLLPVQFFDLVRYSSGLAAVVEFLFAVPLIGFGGLVYVIKLVSFTKQDRRVFTEASNPTNDDRTPIVRNSDVAGGPLFMGSEQALNHIKNAWIAAVVFGTLTLVFPLARVSLGVSWCSASPEMALVCAISIFAIAAGIRRSSRVCAGVMLAYSLCSRAAEDWLLSPQSIMWSVRKGEGLDIFFGGFGSFRFCGLLLFICFVYCFLMGFLGAIVHCSRRKAEQIAGDESPLNV